MSWVTVKCPYCGGMAKKMTVNPSAGHSVLHTSCGKCHKKILVETDHGKVTVYKND